MNARYVEINSEKLELFLQGKGFNRSLQHNEVVYSFAMSGARIVKVYTSIRVNDDTARGCGEDAIRVVAIYDNGNKSFGIAKLPRVYRTGSQEKVHQRVAERIDDAIKRCNEWLQKQERQISMPTSSGEHYGNVGDAVCLNLIVSDRKPWNDRFLFTLKDDADHTFTYWSFRDVLKPGKKYMVRGRIRAHITFKGVNQTDLIECRGKEI